VDPAADAAAQDAAPASNPAETPERTERAEDRSQLGVELGETCSNQLCLNATNSASPKSSRYVRLTLFSLGPSGPSANQLKRTVSRLSDSR
jgi:hypothetical protein